MKWTPTKTDARSVVKRVRKSVRSVDARLTVAWIKCAKCQLLPLTNSKTCEIISPSNQLIGTLLMSNYTPEMVAAITAAAPLNLVKAKELAATFGTVTHRSVISKAQSLGVEYVKLSPVKRAAKADTPTKAAYLAAIRKGLALPEREGDLTKAELEAVLESIA
jgi:hypothetical protein